MSTVDLNFVNTEEYSKPANKNDFGWIFEKRDITEEDDRPLLEELEIDFKDIFNKLKCVLFPLPKYTPNLSIVRENPDFWGPLFVVMIYALLCLYGQLHVVSWILSIWFIGSFFIFMLSRVLGGEISFTQSLAVIGYCMLPLIIVSAVCFIPSFKISFIQYILKITGVVWAACSAGSLLCLEELHEKKPLLLYPIFLLYIYLFSLYSGV